MDSEYCSFWFNFTYLLQCNGEPLSSNIRDEVSFNNSLYICFHFFKAVAELRSDFTAEKGFKAIQNVL